MAGRGTDIKLGGEEEQERDKVVELGGLYVIGTNRHESLRIDRQLRGRAGRQGDPGASRFFVSLEDDLIERYGILEILPKKFRDLKQTAPVADPLVGREIARGQRIIEGQNFEIRRTLWEYSSVIERQRHVAQQRRQEVLDNGFSPDRLRDEVPNLYGQVVSLLGENMTHEIERHITLSQIDRCWADYLAMVANVRESIHLVGVGGKAPLVEFHDIVNKAFVDLEQRIDSEIVKTFETVSVAGKGIDLEREGIKGPSSTWTYLINENQFEESLKGNIGFHAGAAALYGPLYIAMLILRRFYRKREARN
jgi:preprotein translocase subunit SecA